MTKVKLHPHPYTDELHVFYIPAEQDQKMELIVVPNSRDALTHRLSATLLYTMDEDLGLPALSCSCPLSMVLNHDGLLSEHELVPNLRASLFLTDGYVFGDVLMVGQGIVQYDNGTTDVDFISLTPEFHDWRGAGFSVPSPRMPWQN